MSEELKRHDEFKSHAEALITTLRDGLDEMSLLSSEMSALAFDLYAAGLEQRAKQLADLFFDKFFPKSEAATEANRE